MVHSREILRSLRESGWRATLSRILGHLRRRLVAYADLGFDLRNGVDTCRLKSIHDLDVDDTIKRDLIGYEPSPVHVVRFMLRSLPIDHARWTFIDYGSGKARVLMLASQYPFQEIMGIELSKELHCIAEKNIANWLRRVRACNRITSINTNAVDFELPDRPLVLFFFSPFHEPVLAKVILRIEAFLRRDRHDVLIMYYGSRADLLAQFGRLGLQRREIYSRYSVSASGNYRGYLFFDGRRRTRPP